MAVQFGHAIFTTSEEGIQAEVSNLNGSPEPITITIPLSGEPVFANGNPVESGNEGLVVLRIDGTLDPDHLYQIPSDTPPQDIDGGIGKGIVTDGNEDPYGSGSAGFDTPGMGTGAESAQDAAQLSVGVNWINHQEVHQLISLNTLDGHIPLSNGQKVYFLCAKDEDQQFVLKEIVLSEGDSL